MREIVHKTEEKPEEGSVALDNLFVVMCASGFDDPGRVRSALMFAMLAASTYQRTVLYCVQDAVELMVRSARAMREQGEAEGPTIEQRLHEAMRMGVEVQCCTQAMTNRGIAAEDLIEGADQAGGMSLIDLASRAKGSLCF